MTDAGMVRFASHFQLETARGPFFVNTTASW